MTGLVAVPRYRVGAALALCIAIALVPGVVGASFPPDAWYRDLAKPALTPPGWVFPIVWTTLYVAIGTSLFAFLASAPPGARRGALALFALQLVLNGAWSWLFFGEHAVGAALIEMIAMWLAIVGTALAFARHSRFAALLLVPYIAWVGFATYLTLAIWRAN